MNLAEFALLSVICTIVPCRSKDATWENPFTYRVNQYEFIPLTTLYHQDTGTVEVLKMLRNGAQCGYEFRLRGFAPKGAVIPEQVGVLEYWADSYQIDVDGRCSIRADFRDNLRPERTFLVAFILQKEGLLYIEIPVEETRIHPHARE